MPDRKVYLKATGTVTVKIPVTLAMIVRQSDSHVGLNVIARRLAKQQRVSSADLEDITLEKYDNANLGDLIQEAIDDGEVEVTNVEVTDAK